MRIRYVCLDCKKKKRGGYFSIKEESAEIKCPYCGSSRVKKLGP